jgi:signal transduction histidine kinase
MRAKRDYSVKAFLVMQVSIIGWMVFKIFKTISPTEMTRWSFIVAYYACICIFEIAFLEFGYALYKEKPLSNKVKAVLYPIAMIQFLIVITNPYHYLFYSTYDFWRDSFGILFYVHIVIEYSFILIGFIYCARMFKRHLGNKNKWYRYIVVAAIILPLILNFLFITKVIHSFVFSLGIKVIFDITPIVFTWSTLTFVYVTFKDDLMSISPLMKHEIVHKLDTPIGVLDSAFDVIYLNEKMKSLLGYDYNKKSKVIINQIKKDNPGLIQEIKTDIEIEGLYLIGFIKSVYSLKETQYIITVMEVTSYKTLEIQTIGKQKELEKINKKLNKTIEVLKETSWTMARNYVARELHDIIGHSLVVTIKLLEVAKLYSKEDKSLSIEALSDAVVSIDTGMDSMDAISDKSSFESEYTGEILKKDLLKLLEDFKNMGIESNLIFKGSLYTISDKLYDIIKKVCTELMTNTLKHSEAKKIFVSVNIKKTVIDILVIDDGKGTSNIIKGNGLKGIEERLKLAGGSIHFNTSRGDGFMSKITIVL